MITNAVEDKPLPVYGDGQQQRQWLHVLDNCRGILAVLERGRVGQVYNIGGTDVLENLEMVHRLLSLMGKPESLIRYVTDRPGHDRRYALDCSKMERELGWRPLIQLDDGLKQTVGWYRENADWVQAVRCGEYRTYYSKYYVNRDTALQAVMATGTESTTLVTTKGEIRIGKD
jgi:dTDP-glucose 4,6-dehydratase